MLGRVEEEVRYRVNLPPKVDLDPMTHDEVSKHIKGLKIRKATVWKAVVIGIPKPGKPRDLPASYKPISLLSILVKLFERTLKSRLSDHLIGKGLIINEQFGFRPNYSCPQQVVLLIHHYISNRHFSFRLDNMYSSMRPIRAGVPQGSTLSPVLYSAYINDIPRPSAGVQLALFADDTALYLRSNSIGNILQRLQRAIDELTQWLRLWRIDVNPDKSASIYFNYNTKVQFPVPLDTPTYVF
ncbi:Probable RNA-directed DNA polymerase from transposon BS [Eumeta japonica]|uniref:Probable RNA-directed DNA polymerase from transposon BS n=1 Tax=Eumeta variegata TaxID=151549 RepID=A0A4C1XUH2_EUMVA|nr:Probable RNA-directed DNA polymerase from transposon BS [Eumeta japonica]